MATLSGKQSRNQAAQGGSNTASVASPTGKATDAIVNNFVEFVAPRYYTVREDTKSTIRIIDSKGKDSVPPFQNFILGSLTFGLAERSQISETYDGVDILFMGKKPVMVQIGGTLINALNPNWRDEFLNYYENHLRGTKLAKSKSTALLTVDGLLMDGAILNADLGHIGTNDNSVSLSMNMIVPNGIYSALSTLVTKDGSSAAIPKKLSKIQQSILKEITYGTGKSVIMANL